MSLTNQTVLFPSLQDLVAIYELNETYVEFLQNIADHCWVRNSLFLQICISKVYTHPALKNDHPLYKTVSIP